MGWDSLVCSQHKWVNPKAKILFLFSVFSVQSSWCWFFFFSFSKFCKVIIFDATLILIPGLWAPRPTNPVTLLGSTHFYLPLRPPAKVSSRSNLCSNFYPRFSSEPLSHAFKVVLEIDFLVGLEDSSAVPLNGPFCAGFLGAWPTRAHLALTGHHAKKHPFFPISWALAQIPIKVFYSNFLIYHHRAQQKNIDLLRLLDFFFSFQYLKCCFYWMSIQC